VYSRKIRAGKRRTYFFDVRKTKGEDFYLTLTESTRKFNGDGYERHKIFLYKEDFNRFIDSLQEVVEHIKTELMPDYDYDEFTRRHEEYDAQDFEERDDREEYDDEPVERPIPQQPVAQRLETSDTRLNSEDDMSW
jgi:hypothetical protein